MPLYWFLLVISALASDSIPARDVNAGQALMAAAGLMCGWGILARIATRTAIQQVLAEEASFTVVANAFGKQMEWLRWCSLALCLMGLVGFGVAGLLDRLPWGSEFMTLRGLLLLAPGVLATLWTWWCELRFDNATHPHHRQGWWNYAATMFRLQGAWLVIPILLLLGAIDAAQWALGVDRVYGAYAGGALALLALPLALPWILARIWTLRPLANDAQRVWCEQLIESAGVRGTRLQQWDTEGGYCTAMVAGFLPHFRRLLLSDGLLVRLSTPQLSMVVLHELAHVRRMHLPMRLLVLIPVWGVASAVTYGLRNTEYSDVLGIIAGLLASLVALRWVAYRTEFDADRVAVEMAVGMQGRIAGVPQTKAMAGATLANALLAVTMDHPSSRQATWMHPSVADRVKRLKEMGRSLPHSMVDVSLIGDAKMPRTFPGSDSL